MAYTDFSFVSGTEWKYNFSPFGEIIRRRLQSLSPVVTNCALRKIPIPRISPEKFFVSSCDSLSNQFLSNRLSFPYW
jgi:hypothetical protein